MRSVGRVGSCLGMALAAALLGACSRGEDLSRYGCPSVVGINELSRLILWGPGAGRDPANQVAKAEISRILPSECKADSKGVEVEVKFEIVGARGPANPMPPGVAVEYFVAVLDPQRRVIGRTQIFTTLAFEASKPTVQMVEDVQVRIPNLDRERTRNYSIAVGFQIDRQRAAEIQRHWR
jgi:hypothetical protein